MAGEIYVAKRSAVLYDGGKRYPIVEGRTLIRAGHPLLKGHEDLFRPLRVHYDVEGKTETRPTAKKTADKTETR